LDVSDRRAKRLLDTAFQGEKAGGVRHVQTIVMLRKVYWLNGWIVRVDDGETDESLADLYVTPTLPASRSEGAKGFIDHTQWDYPRSFAVEVECYPNKHWDRLQNNYQRNKKMGFPTVFAVPNQNDATQLQEKLLEWQATIVANAAKFEPNHPEMTTIEITPTPNSSQTDNPNPQQNSNSNSTNTLMLEQQPTPNIESLEQQKPINVEQDGMLPEKILQYEQLILELAEQKWHFRLKAIKNKLYLCARKDKKERYISPYTKEIQKTITKNNLTVNDYTNTNNKTNKETP